MPPCSRISRRSTPPQLLLRARVCALQLLRPEPQPPARPAACVACVPVLHLDPPCVPLLARGRSPPPGPRSSIAPAPRRPHPRARAAAAARSRAARRAPCICAAPACIHARQRRATPLALCAREPLGSAAVSRAELPDLLRPPLALGPPALARRSRARSASALRRPIRTRACLPAAAAARRRCPRGRSAPSSRRRHQRLEPRQGRKQGERKEKERRLWK
jgi:hypothetical protein